MNETPRDTAENGLPVEVAAALARVPTCGWHHGQYPDLCWWCGLNRVHVIPPRSGDEGSPS